MYGLKYEIDKRCTKPMNNIFDNINKYYLYLPSAIIIRCQTGKKHKFWLSHGGIDPSFLTNTALLNTDEPIIVLPNIEMQDNLRWCDFKCCNDNNNEPAFNKIRGIGYVYNEYHVEQFLRNNGFDYIIRGHQDNVDQFNLLKKGKNKDTFSIEKNIERKIITGINDIQLCYYNDSKEYLNNRRKGPIAKLVVDIKLYDKCSGKIDNKIYVYPVLTLSTNTDNGRYLRNDSWAILQFGTIEDIKNFARL
jgi:hypothetical protein